MLNLPDVLEIVGDVVHHLLAWTHYIVNTII